MKTETKEWISERRHSYGIFVMHEQLKLRGILGKYYEQGLDIVWEYCTARYNDFSNSSFNDPSSSEYDCIARYVQDYAISELRRRQYDLSQIILDRVGINIVTCGDCGEVILHIRGELEIQCPSCLSKSEDSDCPDLFTSTY